MYHGNHDASMKESYGKGGGKSGGAHGPGGLKAANARNPNKHSGLNDSPCGPYAHFMGYEGDGGMHGGESVKHRSGTYYFK